MNDEDQIPTIESLHPDATPEQLEAFRKAASDAADKLATQSQLNLKDVTVDGYTFKFDPEKIDDVEVIEMAAKIEKGDAAKIIDFMVFLIGEQGYADMKNFYVTRDGKFKLTVLMQIFEAVFKEFDPKG